MGTSKSLPTPSGGDWSPLKHDITSHLSGSPRCGVPTIVGRTVRAAGGLGSMSSGSVGRGGGGGGGRSGGGRNRTSRAVSGLAGFGSSVAASGLTDALEKLGLSELAGRPAAEVVARIAEHLASDAFGLEQDVLTNALRDTLLEIASLGEDGGYDDLASSLESFIRTNGIEGLLEPFLANLIDDQVWTLVEQWAQEKSESNQDADALRSSVESACRQLARDEIAEIRDSGGLDSVDWFGAEGAKIGKEIVRDIERRLNDVAGEEL